MADLNPTFIRISENLDTVDIPDDLHAHPVVVEEGHELLIGGRSYRAKSIRDENGEFMIKNSKDDLKGNLKAYEELVRAGVTDFRIDDLCLRNTRNGNVLIEMEIPEDFYKEPVFNRLFEAKQRNFFVRLDSSMLNARIRDNNEPFDRVEIKTTPCMFAADSAIGITESGRRLPLTERSTVIDENIVEIETKDGFTFYEREIISRLVGAVNILDCKDKISKVTTVIPWGAYYSFLFQGAADGFIAPEVILKWFDRVDERVRAIGILMRKGIHRYSGHEIEIEQYSFMDSAIGAMRKYFEERVSNPKPVDMDELFELVLNTIIEKDSFARQLFDSGVKKPKNFRKLADFTYAVCNLTDMEIEDGVTPDKNTLIIGVFDISETITWNATKKIRNGGLLKHRGQFDPKKSKNTTYDHLSFINVMPIEHIMFDVSEEFAEQYMGGYPRLYSVKETSLEEAMDKEVVKKSQQRHK